MPCNNAYGVVCEKRPALPNPWHAGPYLRDVTRGTGARGGCFDQPWRNGSRNTSWRCGASPESVTKAVVRPAVSWSPRFGFPPWQAATKLWVHGGETDCECGGRSRQHLEVVIPPGACALPAPHCDCLTGACLSTPRSAGSVTHSAPVMNVYGTRPGKRQIATRVPAAPPVAEAQRTRSRRKRKFGQEVRMACAETASRMRADTLKNMVPLG